MCPGVKCPGGDVSGGDMSGGDMSGGDMYRGDVSGLKCPGLKCRIAAAYYAVHSGILNFVPTTGSFCGFEHRAEW